MGCFGYVSKEKGRAPNIEREFVWLFLQFQCNIRREISLSVYFGERRGWNSLSWSAQILNGIDTG